MTLTHEDYLKALETIEKYINQLKGTPKNEDRKILSYCSKRLESLLINHFGVDSNTTIADIAHLTAKDLKKIRGVGNKTANEIEDLCRDFLV